MASLADLNKRLDAAGEGSQPWKATAEGDQIAGKVTVVGSFTHPEYGTSPTLTIDTTGEEAGSVKMDGKILKDAGVMRVLMAGTVLGGSMDEQQIAVGDWVAIRFLGKKTPNSGGKPYNNYAVVKEAPTTSSKLDAAAGAEFA